MSFKIISISFCVKYYKGLEKLNCIAYQDFKLLFKNEIGNMTNNEFIMDDH